MTMILEIFGRLMKRFIFFIVRAILLRSVVVSVFLGVIVVFLTLSKIYKAFIKRFEILLGLVIR